MSVGKESQRDKCLSGMASMCIMKRERRGEKERGRGRLLLHEREEEKRDYWRQRKQKH